MVHEATTWYVQKQNAAVRNCRKTRNAVEHNHRTLLDWCGWCWNVGATSLLALDIRPNPAGIGGLHRQPRSQPDTICEFLFGFCEPSSNEFLQAAVQAPNQALPPTPPVSSFLDF